MKRLEDVKVGDIAIDYNDETYTVVSTAKNYCDAMVKFPNQMCDYSEGIEQGYIEEDEPVLLVRSDGENYAFTYGYDGAYVEE